MDKSVDFDNELMRIVTKECRERLVTLLKSNHPNFEVEITEEEHKRISWIIYVGLSEVARGTLINNKILEERINDSNKSMLKITALLRKVFSTLDLHQRALLHNGMIEEINHADEESKGNHSIEDLLKDLENPPDPPSSTNGSPG